MKNITWNKVKTTVKDWQVGDYIRQTSIVVIGVLITFVGSELVTQNSEKKDIQATMSLIRDELKSNRENYKSIVSEFREDERLSSYFRQFSIVAAGIIVTFWGNDRITENARQKEVRATMQLITEELEYNKQELRNIKHLLDIDIHMSLLLKEHDMDVSKIPTDTLWKYGKLFNNMDEFSYRTDALDVLKGSSLMQYIPDKRMLQDVLQTYFELGRKQRDVGDYYATKTDALMSAAMSRELAHVFDGDDSLRDQALFLVQYKKFINYVNMVPGFLYWHEFDELDERLAKQIQVLKAKYK